MKDREEKGKGSYPSLVEEVRPPPYSPHNVCSVSSTQTTGIDTNQPLYCTPQTDGKWVGMQLTGQLNFTENSGRLDILDKFDVLDEHAAPTHNKSPTRSRVCASTLAEKEGRTREGSVHGGAEYSFYSVGD